MGEMIYKLNAKKRLWGKHNLSLVLLFYLKIFLFFTDSLYLLRYFIYRNVSETNKKIMQRMADNPKYVQRSIY